MSGIKVSDCRLLLALAFPDEGATAATPCKEEAMQTPEEEMAELRDMATDSELDADEARQHMREWRTAAITLGLLLVGLLVWICQGIKEHRWR